MQRINWIDWAKALAVMSVVFCHLPQSQECFYYRYLQALTMVIFFFISGYLKKDRGSNKENWKKYIYGLVIPYIIYNLAVYPYWVVKYYMSYETMPDIFHAIRPLLGALLLEHENAFCEPLNGSLWYLPAILIMHIIIDLSKKTNHQQWIMVCLCIISFFLYAANKYWFFAPDLTPMGLMRNIPYYYMGYLFGQCQIFKNTNLRRDTIGCLVFLAMSILIFAWHLHAYYSGQHLLHIVLFYPTNICFIFAVLYGCKMLNSQKCPYITNISIGTLVVVGLHIVLVTIVNFAIGHLLHISGGICYQWNEALPLTILIITLLYPLITWSIKKCPILIGNKQVVQTR